MALIEGCRHALEIEIPVDDVKAETARAIADVQKRAKLPGFRPGKAPQSVIRQYFEGDVRQKVLEALIPKYLQQEIENQNLHLVGRPDYKDIHYHSEDEPIKFKAEFEVQPDFELGEYKELEVPYNDPEVTDEDVSKRLEELRNDRAEYVNVDPRPIENGDYAVLSLGSISGVEGDPIKQDEMTIEVGGTDTLADFTNNLVGMSPGEEKEFDVTYPEEYGQERFAGKTIRFHAQVKGIRRKEMPELNDEFAQDLGDYRNMDELRDAIKKSLFGQRQFEAQQEAKNQLVEKLVDAHEFSVPETYVDAQIRNRLEQSLGSLARQGVDVSKLNLQWDKVKEAQKDKAIREVKASLILSKVAEREAIAPTRDEVDREVERIARQRREPVAAARMRLEKDGSIGNIASHIQTEKTLTFLFDNARKVAAE